MGDDMNILIILPHPILLPKLQVRSTVLDWYWIALHPPSRFSCTAFIFRSADWISLLIMIPRLVPLPDFIGYGRINMYFLRPHRACEGGALISI
jgi:hypothetical protein